MMTTSDAPGDAVASPATVTEALAAPVAARRPDNSRLPDLLLELGALDRAVFDAVASTPTGRLDDPFRRLSRATDGSVLWLITAGALAVLGGRRGRRVALEGVVALGATAAIVNIGAKSLIRRRRPEASALPHALTRQIPAPTTTSFPSGHSATSFAFAYAVGHHLPLLGLPIRVVAAAVAYSRVHTGVHYPGDVIVGALMGASTAAAVASIWNRGRPLPLNR